MYCAHIFKLQYDKSIKRITVFLFAKLGACGFTNATIGIMLELELRLQANEKKSLEDAPKLKFWMFSRTFRSTISDKSSIEVYAYDHQMYVSNEKMEEVERTLTRP